jgi:hypothetical protein
MFSIYVKKDLFFMKKLFLYAVVHSAVIFGGGACVRACDQLNQEMSQGVRLTLSRAELEDYVAHFPAMKPLVPAELYDINLFHYEYEKLEINYICAEENLLYESYYNGYTFMDGWISKDFIKGYLSYRNNPLYAFDANFSVPVVRTNAPVLPVVTLSPLEQEIADLKKGLQTRVALRRIKELEAQLPGK